MRVLLTLFLLAACINSYAAINCEDFQNENTSVQVLREGNVLTKDNWKTIDVVLSFNRNECLSAISQELLKVNGELFWRFRSTNDGCDGGNTYGSIYSYDLKTPIAHIYDGTIYCKKDWREEERAENHKCDLKAEELAQKKMKKDFGVELENLSSSLLRAPDNSYFIRVKGDMKHLSNGSHAIVTVVLTNVNSCKFGSVYIEHLTIY